MAAAPRPIEFKGTTLTVVLAQLSTQDLDALAASLEAQLGAKPDFFCGEPLVVDCTGVQAAGIDWNGLSALVRRYGLIPLGARNLEPGERDAAEQAGWRVLEAGAAPVRPLAIPEPEPAPVAPAAESSAPGALLIDKPLRSGQQVYARGGDLVVLAMVSAGAEVIADGSIHVYAPLRGRALAGARGDENARIFTTSLEAELVSIAGVWRTFEGGIPEACLRRPAQVRLLPDGESAVLSIEPLSID